MEYSDVGLRDVGLRDVGDRDAEYRENFLSMYFLISSAISCSLERFSKAWLITCLASYSVYAYISE